MKPIKFLLISAVFPLFANAELNKDLCLPQLQEADSLRNVERIENPEYFVRTPDGSWHNYKLAHAVVSDWLAKSNQLSNRRQSDAKLLASKATEEIVDNFNQTFPYFSLGAEISTYLSKHSGIVVNGLPADQSKAELKKFLMNNPDVFNSAILPVIRHLFVTERNIHEDSRKIPQLKKSLDDCQSSTSCSAQMKKSLTDQLKIAQSELEELADRLNKRQKSSLDLNRSIRNFESANQFLKYSNQDSLYVYSRKDKDKIQSAEQCMRDFKSKYSDKERITFSFELAKLEGICADLSGKELTECTAKKETIKIKLSSGDSFNTCKVREKLGDNVVTSSPSHRITETSLYVAKINSDGDLRMGFPRTQSDKSVYFEGELYNARMSLGSCVFRNTTEKMGLSGSFADILRKNYKCSGFMKSEACKKIDSLKTPVLSAPDEIRSPEENNSRTGT